MKLLTIGNAGERDLTHLFERVVWSGDVSQLARKLEFSIVSSPHDENLPKVKVELGDLVVFLTPDGEELFRGYIFSKDKNHSTPSTGFVAYEGSIYLLKNQGAFAFKQLAAEAITKKVCGELGIGVGEVAKTGIPLTFVSIDKSYFETIQTAFDMAAQKNGKKYLITFKKDKLGVIEVGKKVTKTKLVLAKNIQDVTFSETIENMINKVIVTDEHGKKLNEVTDKELIKKYGQFQAVMQIQDEGEDASGAKTMLKDVERKGQVSLVGIDDYELVAGHSVEMKDDYTGVTGKFRVDQDTHTWENGVHKIDLDLNFETLS